MTLARQRPVFLTVGFIIGLLVFAGLRLFFYQPDQAHYHANFEVYINGQKETFDDFTYYEEVTACSADEESSPRARTHMHDSEAGVVHVHDRQVTWGQFFENIGWSVSTRHIQTRQNILVEADTAQVRFILNGEEVKDVAGRVISDRDRLLVDFGSDANEVIMGRFGAVSASAAEFDTKPDPASCSGTRSAGFSERLKHLFR